MKNTWLSQYKSYAYDEVGQLVREDIREDDKTILYVYDVGGNIVSKTEYPYTVGEIAEETEVREKSEYTYGDSEWKDLLTGFKLTAESSSDNIDTQITYDANGNVTSFDGSTYTWTAGRQLESVVSGNDTMHCYYNENGYLTRMDMYDNGEYDGSLLYIWDGDRLVARAIANVVQNAALVSRIIYDTDGESIGYTVSVYAEGETMSYGTCLYEKNLQGDVTGILSMDGQRYLTLTYDAYGNLEAHTPENSLGAAFAGIFALLLTPQLYRGYAYTFVGGDICYYLGSRFYSPKLGRFLNADIHTDTGTGVVGTNMFAYCNNNPVVFVDPTGEAISGTSALQSYVLLCIFGSLFLSFQGYDISAAMYQHAFVGKGKDLDAKTKRKIMRAVKSSPEFISLLDEITHLPYSSITNLAKNVEFKQGDLYYSIQHATCYFSGTKDARGCWHLTVEIRDRYDFDEFRLRKGMSLGNAANDLGVILQKMHLIKPYSWHVKFNQDVKYVRNGVVYS